MDGGQCRLQRPAVDCGKQLLSLTMQVWMWGQVWGAGVRGVACWDLGDCGKQLLSLAMRAGQGTHVPG